MINKQLCKICCATSAFFDLTLTEIVSGYYMYLLSDICMDCEYKSKEKVKIRTNKIVKFKEEIEEIPMHKRM
jgi:hypothetical protein